MEGKLKGRGAVCRHKLKTGIEAQWLKTNSVKSIGSGVDMSDDTTSREVILNE